MGQSVRIKSRTPSFPVEGLNGSTSLPSRFSADALRTVCGTVGRAANPQNKNAMQIILSIGICEGYMTARNAPCKQPQFYTLRPHLYRVTGFRGAQIRSMRPGSAPRKYNEKVDTEAKR